MSLQPKSHLLARQMRTLLFLAALIILSLHLPLTLSASGLNTSEAYRRIVLLGDPHLPGKHPDKKERVRDTINRWDDVDLVVAMGDICQDRGTAEEYLAAQRFFSGLRKPFLPIPGNHDVGYEDETNAKGKRVRVSDDRVRTSKLERFRTTFHLPALYQSRQLGGYLLIFLATDSNGYLAEISETQLTWLESELKKNRNLPAIIFFHAPLEGTLAPYNNKVNEPDYSAQPASKLSRLLALNHQVLLWVSGHTHTTPKEPSFASPLNLYQGSITNIHTTDLNRRRIWTRSLFLYPDRIVIKIWDHSIDSFVQELEQTVKVARQR